MKKIILLILFPLIVFGQLPKKGAMNVLKVSDSLYTNYLRISSGAINGYFLRSDAVGNVSWAVPDSARIAAISDSLTNQKYSRIDRSNTFLNPQTIINPLTQPVTVLFPEWWCRVGNNRPTDLAQTFVVLYKFIDGRKYYSSNYYESSGIEEECPAGQSIVYKWRWNKVNGVDGYKVFIASDTYGYYANYYIETQDTVIIDSLATQWTLSGWDAFNIPQDSVSKKGLSITGDADISGILSVSQTIIGNIKSSDTTKQRMFRVGNNRTNDAFTFTNDPANMNTIPHALMNFHRGELSSYQTNDDLFSMISYHRPKNTDSTKANIGGAWIGTSDSGNAYSSKYWVGLRVKHDHYSYRVNMPAELIRSVFAFYSAAGKARNITLYKAEIENYKSVDAEADTAIAYLIHKSFTDTLNSLYKFAIRNESKAPIYTKGRIESDSSMYALSFNGSGSNLTGVLKPADSTTQRNYSNSLYLKNADSTTLKNSILSQTLKNADSTTLKNSILSQVLKNADSTTLKNTFNASNINSGTLADARLSNNVPRLDASNTFIGATNTLNNVYADTLYGGTAAGGNITIQSTSNATKGKIFFGTSAYDEVNNRLGIGTQSPGQKLVISGSGSQSLQVRDAASTGIFDITTSGINAYFSNLDATGKLFFRTGGYNNRMTIDASGNVGMNTITPFSTVDIKTPFSTLSGLNVTYAPTNTVTTSLAQSIDTSSFNIAFTGTGKPVINLIGATANAIVKIDSTGKVGIGTVTPAGVLDVTSTTGALIVPRMTTTQRDALTPVNGAIIYNTTLNKFNFYENGVWVTKTNEL